MLRSQRATRVSSWWRGYRRMTGRNSRIALLATDPAAIASSTASAFARKSCTAGHSQQPSRRKSPDGVDREHESRRQRAEAKAEQTLTSLMRKDVQQLEY